ncbi:hypothetical protein DEO72_LG10g1265 [Vigna unguiculata]|uniref:Uncharacterized protein n=1 Tax=Vigna unguiculata TaxID=3917 RepID=A0A4D6N888_VIGUN|nr:hypothetical protein DEO72_LG10g1265 [Vigna unguiculata]
MNLPAHGTTSPDPSVKALFKQQTKKAKNNSISAWLCPRAARRNCSRPSGGIYSPPGTSDPRATVFSSPPGGPHRAARHYPIQGPLTLIPPPGAPTRAARRCISSETPLVFF